MHSTGEYVLQRINKFLTSQPTPCYANKQKYKMMLPYKLIYVHVSLKIILVHAAIGGEETKLCMVV